MSYPTYLVHFNKNHSSKDGRFTYGDGDGDGISDDHSNQRKKHSNGALGTEHRKSAKKSGGWHPVTNPYQHSSAANKPPKGNEKRKQSSMFKSGSFAEYKDKNGKVDNKAYAASGAKKFAAGLGAIAVSTIMQNSDNAIVAGAGYVTNYLGWFAVGYGGAQTAVGLANMAYESKQNKK